MSRLNRRWAAVVILATALLVWQAFQTFQFVREWKAFRAILASQEPTIQRAERVRAQLDSIAKQTQELAWAGNVGAASIIDGLGRRGVSIDAAAGSPVTPPATERQR